MLTVKAVTVEFVMLNSSTTCAAAGAKAVDVIFL